MNEPKTLQEQNALQRWLNTLKNWTAQFRILESPDIKPSVGPSGTLLTIKSRGIPAVEEPAAGTFRGEWKAGAAYEVGDMVIRGSNNHDSATWNAASAILADGAIAGLYECLVPIALGGIAEGGGGGQTPITIPGPTEPPVATSVGGANVYYWRTVARFGSHIIAARTVGSTQKILLDSSPGPSGSGVNISLAACNGRGLSIREVEVCVGGVTRHMMVLASVAY